LEDRRKEMVKELKVMKDEKVGSERVAGKSDDGKV